MKVPRRVLASVCRVAIVAAVLCSSLTPTGGRSQQKEAASPPTPGQMAAVTLLRLVNTAEARYHERLQNYATRSQLLESRIPQEITDQMKQRMKTPSPFAPPADLSSPDPAPGYSFALYVSEGAA